MITRDEYLEYLEVSSSPFQFKRLESISLTTIKSIMTSPIPDKTDVRFKGFKEAVIEQMYYYDLNPDLIDRQSGENYTLGSYSTSSSSDGKNDSEKSLSRIAPLAYEKLLNYGLIQSQLGGC